MCSNFHWCLGQENKNLDILVKASNFLKQAAFQKALLAGVGCLPLPCLHVVGGFGSTSVTVTLYVWCHWWPCCSHDLSISATVHCVCVCTCVCVCVLICSVMSDSFVTPMDWSPPGSSVHGIVQARTLEWVAVFFSRGPSWPGNGAHVSCTAGGFFTPEPLGKLLKRFRCY